MNKPTAIHFEEVFKAAPAFRSIRELEDKYQIAKQNQNSIVIILDDDPTGIQTVHHLNVYNTWDDETVSTIFQRGEHAFIHTNSRSMNADEAEKVNREIVRRIIIHTSEEYGKKFELVSRSDSTLRGHFPLETLALKNELEQATGKKINGEIIIPFFPEGGRYTLNDIHYVKDGDLLIPAGETEFARDPDFGYENSDLKHYVQEKTQNKYNSDDVLHVSLEMLREQRYDDICELLESADNFQKIIVNALEYNDLKVFVTALSDSQAKGYRYLFRTAASFVKTFCFVENQSYLDYKALSPYFTTRGNGILYIAGSYTKKTSSQLNNLMKLPGCYPVEIDVNKLIDTQLNEQELSSVCQIADEQLSEHKHPVIFTSRKLIVKDNHLDVAGKVSNSLVSLVKKLQYRPKAVVAKGGITSSVLLVQGLGAKQAEIEGQILPGVPVVLTQKDSKWPYLPYVIFPGNVGDENSLKKLHLKLSKV
jgi:uncharacterized protein YgbK (DUF1537 family)